MRYRIIIGAALLLIGVAGYFACRCDRDVTSNMASQQGILPLGWEQVAIEKTSWLPFKKNVASEYTKEFPPGSKVVVVKHKGEQVEIGILPGGEIVVPKGVEAKVYVKRPSLIKGQIRPFIGVGGVGPELGVAVAAGIDVIRVWRVNLGPGILITNDAVAGAGFAAYPIWRNIDLRVGGGYGSGGGVGFAGITIGIE